MRRVYTLSFPCKFSAMNSYFFRFLWSGLVRCRGILRRSLFGERASTHRLHHQLRLQAALDGELSSRKAQRLADVLARDSEMRSLLKELARVKSALAGNEIQRALPQSRDFYWGQIKQAIGHNAGTERHRRGRALGQKLGRFAVSGHSKPAREGQMKTGHFESGLAHGAAIADQMRDEPTQCEPATFHRHAGGQRLVGAQDRPRTGCASRDGRPLLASHGGG